MIIKGVVLKSASITAGSKLTAVPDVVRITDGLADAFEIPKVKKQLLFHQYNLYNLKMSF